jgi:NTP pyrophosphatase (non-canonical NTP hydrolase)
MTENEEVRAGLTVAVARLAADREIGELSEVIRKDSRMRDGGIKGTIEEKLYDVLYYTLALANVYDIDLAQCHRLKDEINREKYGKQNLQSEGGRKR